MLGGWLALLGAATFAFSNVATRRAVITGNVVQGLSITVPLGVPLFFVATAAIGALGLLFRFTPRAAALLAAAGILHFVIGRYCNYRAIRALGANLVAPIQQSILLVALALAIALLDEVLTPLRAIGIALVLAGPAIMLRRRRGGPSGAAKFTPRYMEGYSFAVLSAVAYGISPVVVRAALAGATPQASIAGGLISYIAATLVLFPFLLLPASRRRIAGLNRHNAGWFAFGGTATVVSQMLRYVALALAPVSVVSPVMRSEVVFRYLFGWFVNRDHEIFGWRVIVATAIAVTGALALTLSTEFVLSAVPLPDAVAAAARWRWP